MTETTTPTPPPRRLGKLLGTAGAVAVVATVCYVGYPYYQRSLAWESTER